MLFDITDLSNFADDNYALTWTTNIDRTIALMGTKLASILSWLIDSGLKANESKTDLCLFNCKDTPLLRSS